jgi:ribonuclease HII
MRAMNRALNEAYKKKEFNKIIIDGNYFKGYSPPGYDTDLIDHECFINGDNIYLNIAAASIVAKNYHDNQILELLKSKPELNVYGLKTNMGYATKVHRDAIKVNGLTEYHRKSFRS